MGKAKLSFSVAGLRMGGGQGSLLMFLMTPRIDWEWGRGEGELGGAGAQLPAPACLPCLPAVAGVAVAGLLHGELALLLPG